MSGLINKKKYRNQKGLPIIEAIVSSVIVGIGFIAIFQMVNYSVNSINVSSERTKANYLVSMIAEGMLGYADTVAGINNEERENLVYQDGKAYLDKGGGLVECKSLIEDYYDLQQGTKEGCGSATRSEVKPINVGQCAQKANFANAEDFTEIHNLEDTDERAFDDASGNKLAKWQSIIEEDQLLKCRSPKEFKTVKMFEMCAWTGTAACDVTNRNVFDESMYLGRIQINLNRGDKRKYLYFQAKYKPKQ